LIQFTNSTARKLGFKSADELIEKYPTIENQLFGPVLTYLSQLKPFGNPFPQSLYLSVFYPAFRRMPLDTLFPDSVRKVNPGIKYVGDYVAKVEKKNFSLKKYSVLGFILPIAAVTLAVYFKQFKRRMENVKGTGIR
jgi:hypothetical protein